MSHRPETLAICSFIFPVSSRCALVNQLCELMGKIRHFGNLLRIANLWANSRINTKPQQRVTNHINHTLIYPGYILYSKNKLPKIKVLCLANYIQSIMCSLLLCLPSFNGKLFSSSFRKKFNFHWSKTQAYSPTPIWDATWRKAGVGMVVKCLKNARLNQIVNKFFTQNVSDSLIRRWALL